MAYAIRKQAASELSDSITLCIVGSGDCKIKYQGIASSFNITKKEIDQGNIASIKSKIKSEAEKEDSRVSGLISRIDQSPKEQSERSIIQILNSSAEETLRSFCGQCNTLYRRVTFRSVKNLLLHTRSMLQKIQELLPVKILF
ncbi:Predicted protein [Wolbachia endosymbiont strain TRS of Brugia malayi]|uniref:WBM0748 family T4SS-associated protein n=1 Tax=Wolbachia endosymbiont of Brugia malayi TaxID=80849 RepID=UPI00004C94F7|nr:hypothetical protein [Wolbachia endosymbiont of Brugia malayi]AAW71336.1 Predicted protein [Wolbachia endosymbiont strain TRS of Brugia malayi]